jgi:hypothetical protein
MMTCFARRLVVQLSDMLTHLGLWLIERFADMPNVEMPEFTEHELEPQPTTDARSPVASELWLLADALIKIGTPGEVRLVWTRNTNGDLKPSALVSAVPIHDPFTGHNWRPIVLPGCDRMDIGDVLFFQLCRNNMPRIRDALSILPEGETTS